MSDLREQLIAAIDSVLSGAGVPVPAPKDDYMTDKLDEGGVWRPKALEAFKKRVLAKYPDQYLPVGDIGPGGVPRRRAIVLFDGFLVPASLKRTDLTDAQRLAISLADRDTFFAAMPDDVNQRLFGIAADTNALPRDGTPGSIVVALHRKHTDLSDLTRLLENTFAIAGVRV